MTFPMGATTQLFSTPYLTATEYQNAPTAVDSSNLIPKASSEANTAELANVIARASSWMDAYCFQVLAATSQTEQSRVRWSNDGILRLHPRYFPIRLVTAALMGQLPSLLVPLALDDTVWVEPRVIEFTQALLAPYPPSVVGGPMPGDRVFVQLTYVAGYPNTTLSGAIEAASSLPVADSTGILPGDYLAVYDDTIEGGTQMVQVATSWIPASGPNTVPIVGTATGDEGDAVSALPPAIKQAAIFVVNSLLKARGSSAIQMASTTRPGSTVPPDPAGPDLQRAKDLLNDFRRVR